MHRRRPERLRSRTPSPVPTPVPTFRAEEIFDDEKDITLEIGTSRAKSDAPDEFDDEF